MLREWPLYMLRHRPMLRHWPMLRERPMLREWPHPPQQQKETVRDRTQ